MDPILHNVAYIRRQFESPDVSEKETPSNKYDMKNYLGWIKNSQGVYVRSVRNRAHTGTLLVPREPPDSRRHSLIQYDTSGDNSTTDISLRHGGSRRLSRSTKALSTYDMSTMPLDDANSTQVSPGSPGAPTRMERLATLRNELRKSRESLVTLHDSSQTASPVPANTTETVRLRYKKRSEQNHFSRRSCISEYNLAPAADKRPDTWYQNAPEAEVTVEKQPHKRKTWNFSNRTLPTSEDSSSLKDSQGMLASEKVNVDNAPQRLRVRPASMVHVGSVAAEDMRLSESKGGPDTTVQATHTFTVGHVQKIKSKKYQYLHDVCESAVDDLRTSLQNLINMKEEIVIDSDLTEEESRLLRDGLTAVMYAAQAQFGNIRKGMENIQ